MTTPENLRSRQRREGFFIILIGVGMLFQTYWNDRKDDRQDACFEAYTKHSNTVQIYRSQLNILQDKTQKNYDLGIITEHQYKAKTKWIDEERKVHPFPVYSKKDCG